MNERETVIDGGDVRLAGTVCVPDGAAPFPFVVFVHGSGPLDRNEDMPGQRLGVFDAFAHHLASAGVASVRYDKRGCAKSTGSFAHAGLDEFVLDAVAVVSAVSRFEECSSVYLVGHSEGCVLAPLAFGKVPGRISGLVLLCPFVPPVEPILVRQAEQLERDVEALPFFSRLGMRILLLGGRDLAAKQRKLLARIRASTTTTLRVGLTTVSAKWLRELLALDARTVFAGVGCPVLLVGGEKDLQCDPADVPRVAALLTGPVEEHVVPDLTHVLRLESGIPSLLGAHALSKQPVAPVVLELTSAWLRRESGR